MNTVLQAPANGVEHVLFWLLSLTNYGTGWQINLQGIRCLHLR